MDGCTWCLCNEKMKKYHDEEWGVPLHDDHRQFEFLMMEVMQCGLNWNMMIQKRESSASVLTRLITTGLRRIQRRILNGFCPVKE